MSDDGSDDVFIEKMAMFSSVKIAMFYIGADAV